MCNLNARSVLLTLAVFGLLPQPQVAHAKISRLAPSSTWEVSYDQDSCVLTRMFGQGRDLTGLYFSRFEPGDAFRLTVVGRAIKARPEVKLKMRFGPSEQEFSTIAVGANGKKGEKALILPRHISLAGEKSMDEDGDKKPDAPPVDPYQISPEREEAVNEVILLRGTDDQLIFETGSLGKPFAVLRDCNEQLMTKWGLDVEKHRQLQRRTQPTGDPRDWLGPKDYPQEMLNAGKGAIVHFRLTVEPTGDVSACAIQKSTLPEEFAEITCNLIKKRARFIPALDVNGDPIRSYWSNTARWMVW